MAHRVTLIPGDGTGPELTEATRRVLEATGVEFEWDVQDAGADVMEAHDGNPLPEETLESIRDTRRRPQGPDHDADRHGLPLGERRAPPRAEPLRLPAAVQDVPRRALALRGGRRRHRPREHEDLYAGIEFESGSEAAEELIATLGRLQPKQLRRSPASRSSRSALRRPSGSSASPSSTRARRAAAPSTASRRRTS